MTNYLRLKKFVIGLLLKTGQAQILIKVYIEMLIYSIRKLRNFKQPVTPLLIVQSENVKIWREHDTRARQIARYSISLNDSFIS